MAIVAEILYNIEQDLSNKEYYLSRKNKSKKIIKTNQTDFFDYHLESGNFHGFHLIGTKTRNYNPVHFIKSSENNAVDLAVQRFIKMSKEDIYITPNQFIRHNKKTKDNLFALSNIVIDLDCHAISEINSATMLAEIDFRLFKNNILPTPSGVVHTGRGLQLWWHIAPVSVKCSGPFSAIISHMCDIFDDFLEDMVFNEKGWSVDRGCCGNLATWVRYPGSYNSKVGSKGQFVLVHTDRYTLNGLISLFGLSPDKQKERKKITYIPNTLIKYASMGGRRAQLESWLSNRKGEIVGYRHNFMLIYACTLHQSGLSDKEVLANLKNVNSSLIKPLKNREIEYLVANLSEKKRYKWCNETIAERLGMTHDEISEFGMAESYPKGINSRIYGWMMYQATGVDTRRRNRARDDVRKKKREEKLEKVAKLYENGFNNKEIAKIMGITEKTIGKYIKNMKNNGRLNNRPSKKAEDRNLKSNVRNEKIDKLMKIQQIIKHEGTKKLLDKNIKRIKKELLEKTKNAQKIAQLKILGFSDKVIETFSSLKNKSKTKYKEPIQTLTFENQFSHSIYDDYDDGDYEVLVPKPNLTKPITNELNRSYEINLKHRKLKSKRRQTKLRKLASKFIQKNYVKYG